MVIRPINKKAHLQAASVANGKGLGLVLQ